jgi:hypothetical protein
MKKIADYRFFRKWYLKKIFVFPVIFLLFFTLSTPWLDAQDDERTDLVKLKKEEEERRKKLKEQNKKSVVITNETLKQYEDKTKKNDGKKKPDVKNKTEKPEKPQKIDPMKTKEYWQKLKHDLEKRINDLKVKVEANQLELNRLTTEHLIMDLPLEKGQLKKQKDEMQRLLEGQKASLTQLQAEYDSLSEKARKAGVPPGWLR